MCRVAELVEQALDLLPQRIRVFPVTLCEIRFELDVDEKAQVRAGQQPFPLAATEEMPQEDSPLDRFGNSADGIGPSDWLVAFRVAGSAILAIGPLIHAALHRARDGKGEMGIPGEQSRGVERFEQRHNQVLSGVLVREEGMVPMELPDSGVEDGDKGEQKNIPQQSVVSVAPPKAQHLQKNFVCGMCSVAVASARTQMRRQRKRVRKSGQQETGSGESRELLLRGKFMQLLFQVELKKAEETMTRGTGSHRRPPDCERQGSRACARCSSFGTSCVFCRQQGRAGSDTA